MNNYNAVKCFFKDVTNEEGKKQIIIVNAMIIDFWESLGYSKVINADGYYELVKITRSSIVTVVQEFVLRDEMRLYCEYIGRQDVWEEVCKRNYTIKNLYEALRSIQIDTSNGDNKTGYLFYQNIILQVTDTKVVPVEYENFPGFIWRDQIIKREIHRRNYSNCDFHRFLLRIANDDINRFRSLISIIGYLLHTYKDPAVTKAIILMDQDIDPDEESANGGTGKSLIGKSIDQMIPMLFINGKSFNISEKFSLSGLESYHKLIFIDDVNKRFDFEALYSMITGDMPLDKKYKNATVLTFSLSPKLLISTNYVIKGSGGNAEKRRKIEYEVSNYFKTRATPVEEFGHRLFDDWNVEEWLKFDNFMIDALRYYLHVGIIEPISIKSSRNRLVVSTSSAFVNMMDTLFENPESFDTTCSDTGFTIDKSGLLKHFNMHYETPERATPHRLKKWIDIYCEYKSIKKRHYKSNGQSLVEFIYIQNLNSNNHEDIGETEVEE